MGIIMYASCGGSSGGFSSDPNKKPLPCRNLTARSKSYKIELTWTDPEDNVIEDGDTITTVKWGSTRIVKKVGSAPESPDDGTMILTSTVRNQYKETPFVDENLTPGTTYYYKAYSCSIDGVYNLDESPVASASPLAFKIMTVVIDLNDSNPKTCGHYEDDAIGMNSGTEANEDWREFFEYKPCILKDGSVTEYLNTNDYSKFEDGSYADITTGNIGDVMIEFPRRGIRINRSGKIIRISMTDDPDNPEFTYYAHSRGDTRKDYFYLGAYLGSVPDDSSENHIRSLSDQTVYHSSITRDNKLRKYVHGECASGYELMTFYQLVYIQVMYCLQYCGKLNYKNEVGCGWYGDDVYPKTGTCDTKGLTYGSSKSTDVTKIFGLEALIPFLAYCFIDGLSLDTDGNLSTTTDNFNDTGSGYTRYATISRDNVGGYISDVSASSELGFFPIEYLASETTYFCGYGSSSTESSGNIICPLMLVSDSTGDHGIFSFIIQTIYFTATSRLSYY